MTLDELAALQGVRPITSLDELAIDLWTDEELDAFLSARNWDTHREGQP